DAVAHERDLREVADPAVTQVLYGRTDLLEGDSGVEEPLDDLEHQDVAEAVEPLGARAMRGSYRRLDQLRARPVVELPVGDAGRRARRRAAVSDVTRQCRGLLVEEQTLLSGTLPRTLTPHRIFLAGRLSLAAADRHADLRLSL